jgi:histidinol-phosphate aminotransferase
VAEFDNLIVLRTFSKWAGLAAVRVGYLIADPELIAKINTIKPPYNVNVLAQETAKAVLRNKKPFLASVEAIIEGRDWFVETLGQRSAWQVVPSQASCMLVRPRFSSPAEVAAELRRRGILVKVLTLPGLKPALRLSAAPVEVMKQVVVALDEISVDR